MIFLVNLGPGRYFVWVGYLGLYEELYDGWFGPAGIYSADYDKSSHSLLSLIGMNIDRRTE